MALVRVVLLDGKLPQFERVSNVDVVDGVLFLQDGLRGFIAMFAAGEWAAIYKMEEGTK